MSNTSVDLLFSFSKGAPVVIIMYRADEVEGDGGAVEGGVGGAGVGVDGGDVEGGVAGAGSGSDGVGLGFVVVSSGEDGQESTITMTPRTNVM